MSAELKPCQWRCFHCDEVFSDKAAAAAHFGDSESSEAACRIKAGAEGSILRALRTAEESAADAWAKLHNESDDFSKAHYAQAARHSMQLQHAEELGYERGLADGRTELPKDGQAEHPRQYHLECAIKGCRKWADMANGRDTGDTQTFAAEGQNAAGRELLRLAREDVVHRIQFLKDYINTSGYKTLLASAEERLARISAHLAAQPVAAEGWQPIETAPRNGDAVLLWAPDYSERASLGWWSENVGAWCADTGTMEDGPTERQDECSGPTHWMPLPVLTARPKRAEGEE